MTERTIAHYARELAGEFYEGTRSGRFRVGEIVAPARRMVKLEDGSVCEKTCMVPFHEAYPTAKEYIIGHWPFFYDLARRRLVAMLGDPRVHKNVKDAILKSIKEDRNKQLLQEARGVMAPDLIGQVQ